MIVRRRIGLAGFAALLILAVVWLSLPQSSRAQDAPDLTTQPLVTTLQPGFNLVGWTQDATPVATLFARVGPQALAVFAWDAAAQRFRSARAAGPAILNDLAELTPGMGLWLLLEGTNPVRWEREVLRSPAPLPLVPGLNLVAWLGPDATPVVGAVEGLASSVWDFDAAAQRFRNFRPAQPAFLNDLTQLATGSGIWLEAIAAASWAQPGPDVTLPTEGQPRVEEGSLSFAGRERSRRLYVPGTLPPAGPAPLVIGLHGGLGSGEQFAESSGFDAQAEAGGFLAVYPDGIARPLLGIRTWNGGGCCGFAVQQGVDDVGFIAALIDTLSGRFAIDPGRVYAVGHSNGGILAYQLACELSDRIVGIGVVAGSLEVPCDAPLPVSVLSIHGDADTSHPLEGGMGADSLVNVDFASVSAALDRWVALNGCIAEPSLEVTGPITLTRWPGCEAGTVVESQIVAGASHAWPGGAATGPLRPQPSMDLDATQALWEFLRPLSR